MKQTRVLIVLAIFALLSACGLVSPFSRFPEEDRQVYALIEKMNNSNAEPAYQKQLIDGYEQAVAKHKNNINIYQQANHAEKWTRIMQEYIYLDKLADAINSSSGAVSLIRPTKYADEIASSKQKAIEAYYNEATTLLSYNERLHAREAAGLLEKANSLDPSNTRIRALWGEAAAKSILSVVITPVNYHAQSFNYWGLNNDYVQQQMVRDLGYQLNNNSIKVYTEWEARSRNIVPDRLVSIEWHDLYVPNPFINTFSKNVSRQIQTGETAEKKPLYTTVYATLYITTKLIEARGTLNCRITEPKSNKTLLWDNFPASYQWREEFATYRGDSRALGSYEWALINNARINDPSRHAIYDQIYNQAYPQLLNRIRSVSW